MYGLRSIGQGSGGVEKAVEELSIRLAQRGHRVTVFCRSRYNPGRQEYQGVRLVNLPTIYTKHLEAIVHSFLAGCASMQGYDIVHVHAVGPALTSFLPRWGGNRVVATVHAMDWRREKWGPAAKLALALGARAATTFPHKTIVVSRLLQEYFRTRFQRQTIYIPNGVTPGTPRQIDRLRRFGVEGNDYLLFLGRLVPEKGCHFLIEAFRKTDLNCRLLVVGDTTHTDNYLGQLRALADNDPRIVFTGALFGDEKNEAYSNAMGLVFPSLLEGMPIVLLEALTMGCPVLCSDIPENLEIIAPEDAPDVSGVQKLPIKSPDDWPAILADFVSNSKGLRARAVAEAQQIAARYNWDTIASQTEEVYCSL